MADSILTFKIGASYYTFNQLADKTLYARKQVIRSDYNGNTTKTVAIDKGEIVGKLYSYSASKSTGKIQFMLYGQYPYYNSVEYDPLAFAASAVEAQGAITVREEEEAKREASKTGFEKVMDALGLSNVSGTLKWLLPTVVIGYAGIKIYQLYQSDVVHNNKLK